MVDRFRALTYVLRQEASFSLGIAGRRLHEAIGALHRFDSRGPVPDSRERVRLVRNAAHALSACVIQREALGLKDHTPLEAVYSVTPEIWNSMGICDDPAPSGRDG
jgi:hypothetical protein